ncbi:MAG: hypothetical protein MUC41_11985 [Syntrophobacteraceae bacterium]|nr:hypothetical protein [Syntrophobacteraceae bacterium]
MIPRPVLKAFAVQTLALFAVVTILGDFAFAQRGRGKGGKGGGAKVSGRSGGFNRRGPASGGNFVSRPGMGIKPTRPGSALRPGRPGRPGGGGRPAWDRPHRPDRPGRPGAIHRPGGVHHHHYYDRWHRRDRWDRWEERRDDWRRWRRRAAVGAGIAAGALAIGAIVSASQWGSMGCVPEAIVVGSVTLYRCGSNWYERVFEGSGDVTYIVVNPPPGY